jgi:succinate-semialdehyde dehydrogenase/glutarate-semialdehyde dehydrogenase
MYPNTQLLIDGKWGPAASGRTIAVLNPATEEQIGTVAHAGTEDLDRALAAAKKGFEAWRKVSAYDRAKIMRKAADLMRARADDIAKLMTLEQGKPLAQARIETMLAGDILRKRVCCRCDSSVRISSTTGPVYHRVSSSALPALKWVIACE